MKAKAVHSDLIILNSNVYFVAVSFSVFHYHGDFFLSRHNFALYWLSHAQKTVLFECRLINKPPPKKAFVPNIGLTHYSAHACNLVILSFFTLIFNCVLFVCAQLASIQISMNSSFQCRIVLSLLTIAFQFHRLPFVSVWTTFSNSLPALWSSQCVCVCLPNRLFSLSNSIKTKLH